MVDPPNTRGGARVAVRCRGYERRVDAGGTFNALVGNLEYPMFIVTARADGEPLGCLVGFATQTSIDPPRFAVCLSHNNRTYRRGRDAELLGGVPIRDECPTWFVGRVLWGSDAGDHDAFLLEPVAAEHGTAEDEFTFHRAKRIDPGHEA
jgi:flavin reductase (DIM6/NTAB) family NADH-FMN oxidoreductase RutF